LAKTRLDYHENLWGTGPVALIHHTENKADKLLLAFESDVMSFPLRNNCQLKPGLDA